MPAEDHQHVLDVVRRMLHAIDYALPQDLGGAQRIQAPAVALRSARFAACVEWAPRPGRCRCRSSAGLRSTRNRTSRPAVAARSALCWIVRGSARRARAARLPRQTVAGDPLPETAARFVNLGLR